MRSLLSLLLPCALALPLVACDDDDGGDAPADALPRRDSNLPPTDDAGIDQPDMRPDTRLDAAPLADAAPPVDAAPTVDAAPMPDAAPPLDAGPVDSDAAPPAPDAAPPAPDAAPPAPDAAPPPEGPAFYPANRLVSPITPHVVANLEAIRDRAPRADDVFAKVGASSTVSTSFMRCFAGANVDLAGDDALQSTIDHFLDGDAGGADPYTRDSEAAVVGWSARNVIAGDPSALEIELGAINPRFALVMYGTNDIQNRNIDRYADALLTLIDQLIDFGTIPILSSIMPRDDDAEADLLVPAYNAVVRGVAQARQVPFVDLHQALLPLPDHGLGPDRLHSSAYSTAAGVRPCVFTDDGLQHGYNWRNLLSITALHLLVETVIRGGDAPDPPQPPRPFTGGPEDPIRITALPFTDLRDTRDSPFRNLDAYPGCQAAQDESGPEYVYRLDLARPTTVRAYVMDRGSVDIDVHLMGDPTDPASCLDRAHTGVIASLEAGTWYFVLDTFVSAANGELPGEYLFVVVEEP
jgi:hypothetical protein